MPEIPRLNGVIRALAQGQTALVGFASPDSETATALAGSNLDGVAFEMEHAPMSVPALRDALQYMLDRRQIVDSGTLAPKVTPGEILVVIQCEEVRAIENLPRIRDEVRGIGVVLIGEGDLSQELGHPRDYEHPVVAEAIDRILKICQDHGVPCGHPHPDAKNIERLIASGYRFLMPGTPRSFAVLEQGRKLAGRA
jgi:2-keto-3-deoxy-L-rhamnonate aldolase RhmA